jgi:diguanylate cyclase (GGDEF)-like protein
VDLAGRWGGEEFLVVLDRCNGEQAGGIAEDLRARIADRVHPGVGQVTISIGVAAFRPDDTQDSLVSRADRALYAAKHGGRNQVAVEQAVG